MDSDGLLPYMRDVARCASSLRELNQMWRTIETTARMVCPEEAQRLIPMLSSTREGFSRLEYELVDGLVEQKASNVMSQLGTMAQHVIDLIVRNLYERTADVGFLATDRVLCDFVAGVQGERENVVARLKAYRGKYTVYDEIVLLDGDGMVLANIDSDSPIQSCCDPLIAQTLESDNWVETYRASDVRPLGGASLIYSRRILHPLSGRPVGVLCLVFGLATEMASIFGSRQATDGRSLMLLLDGDNRVIASADPSWVQAGSVVPVSRSGQPELFFFRGGDYLVRTTVSSGYQGYPGPRGWQAQVMVPAQVAFGGAKSSILPTLDPTVAAGLLDRAAGFCPPLAAITRAAQDIRRVVWNGQVMASDDSLEAGKLSTVLEQISETGARSDQVFVHATDAFYEAVLAANGSQAEFASQLLVELLDRNLYERSDDCRWWAMTPELCNLLQDATPDSVAIQEVASLLAHINSLYTVYTQLVVYDRTGRILAASRQTNSSGQPFPNGCIETDTLQAVLTLPTQQSYHVTPFRSSALYGNQETYVYHAAVRSSDDREVLGGIGIVFDARAEFTAMLQAGLVGNSTSTALFVDRAGRVIGSTSGDHVVGSMLPLPSELLQLENGRSAARITVREGEYAVVACAASHGYREFKTSDGYREDVIAVVLKTLGAQSASQPRGKALKDMPGGPDTTHYAALRVAAGVFALPAKCVAEALPAADIKPVSLGAGEFRTGILPRHRKGKVHSYVWVFDLNALLCGEKSKDPRQGSVVVFKQGEHEFGLLVGDLNGVPAFTRQRVEKAAFVSSRSLVSQIVNAEAGAVFIQLIDPARLLARLLAIQNSGDADEVAGELAESPTGPERIADVAISAARSMRRSIGELGPVNTNALPR